MYAHISPNVCVYKGDNKESLFKVEKDLKFCKQKYRYIQVVGKDKAGAPIVVHKKIPCHELLNDLHRELPVYNYIDTIPDKEEAIRNPRTFNTWRGFQARQVDMTLEQLEQEKDLQYFLDYTKYIFCNGNETLWRLLMTILRRLITHPGEKVPGCWFAQGAQRVGKTAIYDVLKRMFGRDLCLLNKGLDTLYGRWNGRLVGKKLIFVEEASVVRETFLSAFDSIKHLLTGTTFQGEKKFLEPFPAANLFFVIILSNHINSVFLEDDDRRYIACEVSPAKLRDTVYWDTFYAKCDNQACSLRGFSSDPTSQPA